MKRLALYLRLSLEDEGEKDESNSISNQRKLIYEYIHHDSELSGYEAVEFSDDGFSGANMNRPGMQKLLKEVKANNIICIIVKDMSRFSRDYIEMGTYLNQIFPFVGIRFIAINDHYDSAKHEGKTIGMDIAFKNLIYDYYSKDLSKKVKSAMGMKQETAKFVNTVPYGYKADPVDKHHLIIDVETAPIVRRIFMEVIGGKSCTQIAKELNTEGIPTPAQHKAVSRKASSKKPQWTHRGILTMIESVKYTGTMVNHTRESRFIRDKNQRRVPKEEWYVRENAHEAIVTKDEYEQAQEAIQRRRKFVRSSHDQSDRVYFCAHCGGKLEKANGTVFACPSHRYHDSSPCENVRWRKSALEEIVFEALKRQIEIVSIESAAVRKTAKSKDESLERQLVLLKAQYDACDREKFTIYENYREGKLTPEEYLSGKDALAQKQAALKEQLESCETQLEVFHQQSLDAEDQHEAASRMTGLSDDKLREHLYDAVERVLVYDTETIEIVWKFNESKIDTDENIGVAN